VVQAQEIRTLHPAATLAKLSPRHAAGMFEAKKGFRPIKAYKQLPILKQALIEHRQKDKLDQIKDAA